MKREFEEIEVDVEAPTPKSKKEKRLEKKGKTVEKPEVEEKKNPNKRSEFGVWIGNLPFSVDKKELTSFILDNTGLNEDDLTRIHLDQKKGYAYVDTKTADQAKAIMVLSERDLGGRNVLIKGSKQFDGRPSKEVREQKNPPTRVLFVGNLSFETNDDELEQHFQHCGEIQRIRTATFQDSGKCKGFTFIDFVDVESATKALGDKRCKKLNGRALRMEYGEDRSQRKPKREQREPREPREQHEGVEHRGRHDYGRQGGQSYGGRQDYGERQDYGGRQDYGEQRQERQDYAEERPKKPRQDPEERRAAREERLRNRKPTPGQALANAQRAKATAAPSGKKITFD